MPHRLWRTVAPVAYKHAKEMSGAIEALVEHACLKSALCGALIAQGHHPRAALAMVDDWHARGMFMPRDFHEHRHMYVHDPMMGPASMPFPQYREEYPLSEEETPSQ